MLNVENQCKTLRKFPRKSCEILCGLFLLKHSPVYYSHLSTKFSNFSHSLSHNYFTPILYLIFPHFHIPYNYNYNI